VLTSWIIGKNQPVQGRRDPEARRQHASQVLTADGPEYFAAMVRSISLENPQAIGRARRCRSCGNVKTPTLVVVGSEDYRTPVSESSNITPLCSCSGCRRRW
jgi:hypothetical protein